MKKGVKICVLCITIFVILSTCLITSSAYSNQYPAYLGYAECAYVEVQSNLGKGSVVIPQNYQYGFLSLYNLVSLSNIGSSTINGYFILENGTAYTIRIQALNYMQYSTQSGYQTVWNELTFSQIYNTNCDIRDVAASSSDHVYKFSVPETFNTVLLILILVVEFLKLISTRVKSNARTV